MSTQRQLTLDFKPRFDAVGAVEVFHHLRMCNSTEFVKALKREESDVALQLVAMYLKQERKRKPVTGLRNETDFGWRLFEHPRRVGKVLS